MRRPLIVTLLAIPWACSSAPACTSPVPLGRGSAADAATPDPGPLAPTLDAAADEDAGVRAVCISDRCATPFVTCPDSRFLCDTNIEDDPKNCGECGHACPDQDWLPQELRAHWECVQGACQMVCNTSSVDCNGYIEDGCEARVDFDTKNCGACGRACGAGQECRDGQCVDPCPSPRKMCPTGYCADVLNEDWNCGVCENQCPLGDPTEVLPDNTYRGCVEGECGKLKCNWPYADCNGLMSDGCEVATNTTENCGKCGRQCAPGEMCQDAKCVCDPGPDGCGCIRDVESDPENCGACGAICPSAYLRKDTHGGPVCKGGVCGYACLTGYGDCNGDVRDGCEASLMNNPQHCGACNVACAPAQSCVDGACATEPCPPGVEAPQ